MKQYWYRVEIEAGSEAHCYFGSSDLTEQEFLEKIQSGSFIQLDNHIYYDEAGVPRSWTSWDPNAHSRIYFHPKYVMTVVPLKEDPRRRDGESTVLAYPGGPSSGDKE